jgi:hypothetical protein
MSTLRVDNIKSRTGTTVTIPETNTLAVTGIVSITSSGSITNAGSLTNAGNVNITGGITTVGGSATISGNVFISGITTISGNLVNTGTFIQSGTFSPTNINTSGIITCNGLTVNGTQTIVNTQTLEVADKNIGIGSTSSPTDALADGAGITIYGSTNKTITWERDTGCFEYNQPSKFKGVIETVSTASTYDLGGGRVVLELDVRNATTYTHSLTNGTVGIVSFKNMPADTGVSNGTTITVLFTQNSAGTANTTVATGIGTNCFIVGFEDGATVAGISTRALVGSATTVTLSTTGSDRDFVSFFVHYTGGTNTTASSYQVYATKNGGFRQGTVGV